MSEQQRLSWKRTFALRWCALWGLVLTPLPAIAQLSINAMDYDQSQTDHADFVELYEPAQSGMSLSGWQLVLYNGQSSQRNPYLTIELNTAPGGVMPADGYLVIGPSGEVPNVDIPAPSGGWIQNGAPDGMALVHDGVVVELLSYEGSFAGNTDGSGGPAAGMTFPDIGVEDYGGDDVGLQKVPDEGTWTRLPDWAASPGEPNPSSWTTQTFGGTTLLSSNDAESGPIALCADGGTPPYVFHITMLPTNGQLIHDAGTITQVPTTVSGTLTYAPDAGFDGLDTFKFEAEDSTGAVSPAVAQTLAVQDTAAGVVISELMLNPSSPEQTAYEFIEIYNRSGAAVALGRLDTVSPLSENTVDNLLGTTIPAGTARIIGSDGTTQSIDLELLRCEWGVLETEIIRVPHTTWEYLFSDPDGACAATAGSLVLLFDAGGGLLDAVDLSADGLPAPVTGESLTIVGDSLVPPGDPLDAANNDAATAWACAGQPGIVGARSAQSGDLGSPMVVPTLAETPYALHECVGRCCVLGEGCEVVSFDECSAVGGDTDDWAVGATCVIGLVDYAGLSACLSGPGTTASGNCDTQDQDGDLDVDLADFALFQLGFGGPACPGGG